MKQIKRQHGKLVLGDGEVTGHLHTIAAPRARMFEINTDDMRLELPTRAVLRHEIGDKPAEHRDIQLPSGVPTVTHKRQYIPNGWTRVVD